MSNLLELFNSNVKVCYKKMNLVSLDTKRSSDHSISQIDWSDFEVGVQLVQEYVFYVISDLDKDMFYDDLRHYLYSSKLQKNIATFSLCSPDSLRFLAWTYHNGDYCKIPPHALIAISDIDKVGIAFDFSIGDRLGVDLPYDSDDYMIDKDYAIKKSLESLIKDCNPLRLQYCMSYCGRFVRLVRLFQDYFTNLYHETKSVTAFILEVGCYWINRNICYELNEMNAYLQSYVRSPYVGYGDRYEDEVKLQLNKFNKSHNHNTPSVDDIKAEILSWIK